MPKGTYFTWTKAAKIRPILGKKYLCWARGWDEPIVCVWKTNPRLEGLPPDMRKYYVLPYYGDENEMDDIDMAKPENFPDYVMEYPAAPTGLA